MAMYEAPRNTIQATFFDGIASRRKFNVADEIAQLTPAATPLLTLLYHTRKQSITDPDFSWNEHRPKWIEQQCGRIYATGNAIPDQDAGAGDGLTTTNRLKVTNWKAAKANGTGEIPEQVVPGVVIQVKTASQGVCNYYNFVVTSVEKDTGFSYINVKYLQNVASPIALSSSAATPTVYNIIGSAHPEGGDIAHAFQDDVQVRWGSAQIFKTLVNMTRTMRNMALVGGSEAQRVVIDKAIEHAVGIEKGLLFGNRVANTTSNNPFAAPGNVITDADGFPIRATAGLQQICAWSDNEAVGGLGGAREYVVNSSSYEYTDFINQMESLFRFGSKSRLAFCSAAWISFFNILAATSDWIRVDQSTNSFGISIFTFRTAHGTINLVEHPLLNGSYNDTMFVVDMNNVTLMEYEPTNYQPDVNIKRVDGQQDLLLSDVGLKAELPETIGVFYLY
jgi:hypothetical protein